MQVEIGRGRVGLRQNGKHLLLSRGKKGRAKKFKVPDWMVDMPVRLVAIYRKSDSTRRAR